jgi:hypothetical protein
MQVEVAGSICKMTFQVVVEGQDDAVCGEDCGEQIAEWWGLKEYGFSIQVSARFQISRTAGGSS